GDLALRVSRRPVGATGKMGRRRTAGRWFFDRKGGRATQSRTARDVAGSVPQSPAISDASAALRGSVEWADRPPILRIGISPPSASSIAISSPGGALSLSFYPMGGQRIARSTWRPLGGRAR